jgi:hypothetical protein
MTAADSPLVAVASASPLVLSASADTRLVPVSGVPAFRVASPATVWGEVSKALAEVLVAEDVEVAINLCYLEKWMKRYLRQLAAKEMEDLLCCLEYGTCP